MKKYTKARCFAFHFVFQKRKSYLFLLLKRKFKCLMHFSHCPTFLSNQKAHILTFLIMSILYKLHRAGLFRSLIRLNVATIWVYCACVHKAYPVINIQ